MKKSFVRSSFIRAHVNLGLDFVERYGAELYEPSAIDGEIALFIGTRHGVGGLIHVPPRELARVLFASWSDRATVRWAWRAMGVSIAVRQAATLAP